MNLKHAKMVLSGEYRGNYNGECIHLLKKRDGNPGEFMHLNKKDIEFMLRQLALKVVGEKENKS